MSGPLGRRPPTDWRHVESYPRSAFVLEEKVPVVLGINWYSSFDDPELINGTYWIGHRSTLGTVRGGHAICTKPTQITDPIGWWDFYDQGSEGACVGFACSRMMSILNQTRYRALWLYREAQLIDEWDDTPPGEGTSVRAGCDILRDKGHWTMKGTQPYPKNGIVANAWATDWQQVRDALQLPDSHDGVVLLNSWGRDYPRMVRITDEAGARLLREDGEACLVVDRVRG